MAKFMEKTNNELQRPVLAWEGIHFMRPETGTGLLLSPLVLSYPDASVLNDFSHSNS